MMSKEEINRPVRPESVFFVPSEVLKGCEDLTSLPYLYDETVVDCITTRYKENLIYTWAGPILVAVNPVKSIKYLYSLHRIKEIYDILKDGKDHQDPHVFTVAGLAHCRLVSEIGLVNQAILVSGESGSGKTESAKFLLTYLTQVESAMSPVKMDGQKPEEIKHKILASNPILEAFGNAATLRNHNSSRFGKLLRLQYRGVGLKGATIDTYLLEKTRVTSRPDKERNFHVFYQLLSGLRHGFLTDLGVEEDSFVIASGDGQKDSDKDLIGFKETLSAFNKIGVSSSEQSEIFQIVAAIMYLGNISFEFNSEKEAWTLSSSKGSTDAIGQAGRLLGLTSLDLEEVFTIKKIKVTTGKETTVFRKVCEREDQCVERRDSLMQLLYSSIFARIVAVINSKIIGHDSLYTSYLGILDIYGFEAFEDNSLEQLCINYANERLQQEFTQRYIASEHRLLMEEGFLDFPFLFSDNSKCVSALDSPVSVFSILNEECQLRKALNEEETCERVCHALHETGVVSPVTSPQRHVGFIIKHYAASVTYTSEGLLHKNKDEVPQEIGSLLSGSENAIVVELSRGVVESEVKHDRTRRGRKKITTLSKFKSSLDALIKILTQCDLHYVRCLKPQFECVPGPPDKSFLLDQLKTNGILETVKISQAGYPIRMLYPDFALRYNFEHCEEEFSPKEVCFMVLLDVLGSDSTGSPPEERCRFGRKRIFLSESSLHKLEEMREMRKDLAATCIQKNFKRYTAQKKYRATVLTVRTLQRRVIGWLLRRYYLRKRQSAILLQRMTRGSIQKRRYQKTLRAVKVLQRHWRAWLDRKKRPAHGAKVPETLLRPGSRMSFGSSCYGSLASASLTDYSTSDAEVGIAEDALRVRRLLETEESGIETDTESLSGDGHKVGRSCRLRTRHDHAHLRPCVKGSDEDASSVDATRGPPSGLALRKGAKRQSLHVALKANRLAKEDVKKKRGKSSQGERDCGLPPLLRLGDSTYDVPLFYREGILSYRRFPKGKIKFHTKATCLPYSTSIPIHERPQGLIDAVR